MKNRIVVNVTASANWRRRPVGIIRVERELVKQIHRVHPDRIEPVMLDMNSGQWNSVSAKAFDQIFSDDWVHSETPDATPLVLKTSFPQFRSHATDRFVSVGSDWSFDVPERVRQLYGDSRVLITALYDLIPLLFPEFTPGPEFFEQFNRHYTSIARYARSVFAISEHSKKDLLVFWEQAKLDKSSPRVEVVPLAGLAKRTSMPKLDKQNGAQLDNVLKDGPYVIFVSTVEPRKNHQLMLDIWRQLHIERGDRCPKLIIVGMRGWGSDNLIEQMTRMNAASDGKLLWLQGVDDNLLAHLYANAMFAVLPSHYEGWGLAATEAASFGKICVVSNNSALSEATAGLSPSHHPLDFPAWFEEICRLIDDVEYRVSLERRISEEFTQRTWDDFGDEFSAKLL